jgi:hypothetical protein
MYTIVDSITGLVLFAKNDNEVFEGQTAINKVCLIEGDMPKYINFETQEFYVK